MKTYKDLTPTEINEIENLYINSNLICKDIAAKYGVKRAVVNYACKGLNRINYKKNFSRAGVLRGEDSHLHKLSEDNVKNIILRLLKGERQWSIAKEYGINQSSVSCIKTGKTWKALFQKMAKSGSYLKEVIKEHANA